MDPDGYNMGPELSKQKNKNKIAIIFISISLNMCFGCSKEPFYSWEIRKIIFQAPVSLLANEFDVQSLLHGKVSSAAVNQICVVHEAMNGCKNLKIH